MCESNTLFDSRLTMVNVDMLSEEVARRRVVSL